MQIDFDAIVKTPAACIDEKDVRIADLEVERQIDGRALNRNQPLNMIAYGDQQ